MYNDEGVHDRADLVEHRSTDSKYKGKVTADDPI